MLIEHSEKAYNAYSLITHRTFNQIFPDIEEEFKWNDRVLLKKQEMLELLQKNQGKQILYPEELEEVLSIAEIDQLLKKGDSISESIRIQSLTRNKLGIEKDTLIKNRGEPDRVYQLSIKLNTTVQLLNQSTQKADLINDQLGQLIRTRFANEKESLLTKIEEVPLQVKLDILRHYKVEVSKGFVPSLKSCILFSKEQESNRSTKYQAYEKNETSSFFNRLSSAQKDISHFVGGRASIELFDQLIHQSSTSHASKQEAQTSSRVRKKTKDKRIRQQLDLEVDL